MTYNLIPCKTLKTQRYYLFFQYILIYNNPSIIYTSIIAFMCESHDASQTKAIEKYIFEETIVILRLINFIINIFNDEDTRF